MKLFNRLVVIIALWAPSIGICQQPPQPAQPQASPEVQLTRFNLDFPGGTPKELVAAIQKATGKPLNAIINADLMAVQLPPLKMTGVNVDQLFSALWLATQHRTLRINTIIEQGFTFRTNGKLSDDNIWYGWGMGQEAYPEPGSEMESRFYLLTPYLEKGLTVDDITTAIQTGWKLLGSQPVPSLSYHQETKLLIAVGQTRYLTSVDAALKALGSAPIRLDTTVAPPAAGAKKSD